ncbi:Fic family protein [Saprospira grandis]|uniref:Filamentation induced by cAMP protein Fic n=1 Tax=Saprospira grandis (strain Lewin) TaxID=984262 RepID=H6L717_SAPGL|nr:Fic family protein [Saprospira grandis]AFC26608.1 filamentation induced by cAMP protein Fic [Saprospira grandis str. Lewin]
MKWQTSIRRIKEIQEEIAQLGELSKARKQELWERIRLDWNYHSNAMEGNTLTLSETKILLTHGIHAGNKYGRHYEEMKLHHEVLNMLQAIVREERPITQHLIRGLHAEMMGEKYEIDAQDPQGNPVKVAGRPGEYKKTQNFVQRGAERYTYAAVEDVEPRMQSLIAWLQEEEEKGERHPIELACRFHLEFVTIHPFDDGNGRMGRILMNLILMRMGLAPAIILREEKEQYLRRLIIAQDGGALEPLLDFVAESCLAAMEFRLKAYRGESLERPDDWEKRLLLLREGPKLPTLEKNAERVYESYYKSILPLFERLKDKLKQNFAPFFYDGKDTHYIDETEVSLSSLDLDFGFNRNKIKEDRDIMDMTGMHNSGVSSAGLHIQFISLMEDRTKSLEITIKAFFHGYSYRVVISSPQIEETTLLDKRYAEEITAEEQATIISTIGSSLAKQLEALLKKKGNEDRI